MPFYNNAKKALSEAWKNDCIYVEMASGILGVQYQTNDQEDELMYSFYLKKLEELFQKKSYNYQEWLLESLTHISNIEHIFPSNINKLDLSHCAKIKNLYILCEQNKIDQREFCRLIGGSSLLQEATSLGVSFTNQEEWQLYDYFCVLPKEIKKNPNYNLNEEELEKIKKNFLEKIEFFN
jgi:hypothetical protein